MAYQLFFDLNLIQINPIIIRIDDYFTNDIYVYLLQLYFCYLFDLLDMIGPRKDDIVFLSELIRKIAQILYRLVNDQTNWFYILAQKLIKDIMALDYDQGTLLIVQDYVIYEVEYFQESLLEVLPC